jgi:hypothetical protein
MDVVDASLDRFGIVQVAVKATSFLPESKTCLARTLADGQISKQPRVVGDENFFHILGKWLLESGQLRSDPRILWLGIDQQVNVFWHEHKGSQIKLSFEASSINQAGQLSTPRIISQQRFSPIAGKRQFMKIPWLVTSFQFLPMRFHVTYSTDGYLNVKSGRHWQSQWHPKSGSTKTIHM